MPHWVVKRLWPKFASTPRRRRLVRRARPMLEALEDRLVLAASVVAPLADFTVRAGTTPVKLDLYKNFSDSEVSGTLTKWDTNLGSFYVTMYDDVTPMTVQNFLNYVNSGAYNGANGDTFFHRAVNSPTPFVLQGGGFRWNGTDDNVIATLPPVPNEFQELRTEFGANAPINTRGTIAMAKTAAPADGGPINGGPNSATSQWFFNLANNAGNLDNQNGGFTTFGEVIYNGMDVVDAINSLPTHNRPGVLTEGAYTDLPLTGYTAGNPVTTANLARVTGITIVQELTFQIVGNTNGSLATIGVNNGQLTVTPISGQTGVTQITVRATDVAGNMVEDTFQITVGAAGNRSPVNPTAIANIGVNEDPSTRSDKIILSQHFSDPDGNALTYSVVKNTDPRLAQAVVAGNELNLTVFRFEHGTANITVRATDTSGAYVDETFAINVTGKATAPLVASAVSDTDLNEDFGQRVIKFYDVFYDPDVFTDNQGLTFSITQNSNPSLVTTQASGYNAIINSVANAVGTATITIRATDAGGKFTDEQFTITVLSVNDAPTFTPGASLSAGADQGPQSVAWATAISAGPTQEAAQTLSFEIVSNSRPELFSAGPTISPNGTLNYTLSNAALGVSTIMVRLKDNGGVLRSGVDASTTATFTIESTFNPWKNTTDPFDVNGAAGVTQTDVQLMIDELVTPTITQAGTGQLPLPRGTGQPFFDVDGHLYGNSVRLTAFDILAVVNQLRRTANIIPAEEINPSSGLTLHMNTVDTYIPPSLVTHENLGLANFTLNVPTDAPSEDPGLFLAGTDLTNPPTEEESTSSQDEPPVAGPTTDTPSSEIETPQETEASTSNIDVALSEPFDPLDELLDDLALDVASV